MALILQNNDIKFSGLDLVDRAFAFEMEFKGFSAGVNKRDFGLGVWRLFDQLADDFPNATSVTIAHKEDFFGGFCGRGGPAAKKKEGENKTAGQLHPEFLAFLPVKLNEDA